MKYFLIILIIIFVFLFLKISIYIKYDEKFEIWLNLVKLFNFRVNLSTIIKKHIKIDNIKIDLKLLKNKLTITSYLIKDLLKRITLNNLTILEYSNILSDNFILGVPYSFYYMNIILKDNLEKYFKDVKNSYYSLNFNTVATNNIKIESEIEIRIYNIILFIFKNFKFIFGRKANDRT